MLHYHKTTIVFIVTNQILCNFIVKITFKFLFGYFVIKLPWIHGWCAVVKTFLCSFIRNCTPLQFGAELGYDVSLKQQSMTSSELRSLTCHVASCSEKQSP